MSVGRRIAKRIARLHPKEVHGHVSIDRMNGIVTVDTDKYMREWAERQERETRALNRPLQGLP